MLDQKDNQMDIEHAEYIVSLYERYEDISCSCHRGNPPCGKCELSPSEEDYLEAIHYLEEN